jgi:hypothetical protein
MMVRAQIVMTPFVPKEVIERFRTCRFCSSLFRSSLSIAAALQKANKPGLGAHSAETQITSQGNNDQDGERDCTEAIIPLT